MAVWIVPFFYRLCARRKHAHRELEVTVDDLLKSSVSGRSIPVFANYIRPLVISRDSS